MNGSAVVALAASINVYWCLYSHCHCYCDCDDAYKHCDDEGRNRHVYHNHIYQDKSKFK